MCVTVSYVIDGEHLGPSCGQKVYTMTSRCVRLVGFAGRKGCGKDSCADVLTRHCGFVKHAFAGPLKCFCRDLFMLHDEQLWGTAKDVVDPRYGQTPRQLMQGFGTDYVRRTVSQNFWTDRFVWWYRAQVPIPRVVVCDVRFQNEVDAIHGLGGLVFRVCRPEVEACSTDLHVSERPGELQGLDGVIVNTGSLQDLERMMLDMFSQARDSR